MTDVNRHSETPPSPPKDLTNPQTVLRFVKTVETAGGPAADA